MSWTETHCVRLDVPQASGLAALDDGTFAVVCDEGGVYRAHPDGRATPWIAADRPTLRDLEGICRDDAGTLWLVSERTGAVSRVVDDHAEPEGVLPTIGKKRNKGWEGIAYRPERFGGPHLIACHERSPRRLGVFGIGSLDTVRLFSLPKKTKRALADLSDLTVDPNTGHWMVLSDESARIAVVRPRGSELEHLDVFQVNVGKNEKPEGLAFDGRGDLWMVTDGDPHLRRLER